MFTKYASSNRTAISSSYTLLLPEAKVALYRNWFHPQWITKVQVLYILINF